MVLYVQSPIQTGWNQEGVWITEMLSETILFECMQSTLLSIECTSIKIVIICEVRITETQTVLYTAAARGVA